MRRVLAVLTLLVASAAAALVASSGATGVQPTFSITLNPTTPDPGSPVGFSGHCSNADAIGMPIHVLMFNVVEVSTMGEVDPVIDASGDFSGSFPAGWAPVAGWYQVVTSCPFQSVTDGYQASPIIDASMELIPQAMTVSTGPGDADKPLQIVVDVAGANCDGKAVYWTVLDGSLNQLASGTIDPDTDGTWSAHVFTDLWSPPADSTRTAYAMCLGGEVVLGLYSGTSAISPPVTDPPMSTTTNPQGPTTTVAGAPATAATAVSAAPTYTG